MELAEFTNQGRNLLIFESASSPIAPKQKLSKKPLAVDIAIETVRKSLTTDMEIIYQLLLRLYLIFIENSASASD